MPPKDVKKEKLINFRLREDLLEEIDDYWKSTGKFSSRTDFFIFLVVDELQNRTMMRRKNINDRIEDLERRIEKLEINHREDLTK